MTLASPWSRRGLRNRPRSGDEIWLFFTGIARVVLPPPGFDKEAVSRGLEKIGNEVVARM